MEIDEEKTAEIALAVLSLTAHRDGPLTRMWKGVDWGVMEFMCQRAWILSPAGKAKSVVLTDEGITKSAELRAKYLSRASHDVEALTRLEHGLWQADKRYNEQWLRDCLHREFTEIGRSGRKYSYDDMFPVVPGELDCRLPLPNFGIKFPASGIALVSYESHLFADRETLSARRTSLWVHEGGRWLLLQHQGTAFDENMGQ